jgi:hypothetical protein
VQVELEISGEAEEVQAVKQPYLTYILHNEAASNAEYILMVSDNLFDSK